MTTILTYHIKHNRNFDDYLDKARKIANYAVLNKKNKKILTSKYVTEYELPSAISNQILRKYGKGTIKEAKNVNLIVPGQGIRYNKDEITVTLIPMKVKFRWNCGREFIKINQVEIDSKKFMVSVTFNNNKTNNIDDIDNILSIDLNCGYGRHIINAADHKNKNVLNLGKNGPHIRYKYFKLRQKCQKNKNYKLMKKIGSREKRRMKDLDHKLSKKIVDYAKKNKLKIIMENLKGIRKTKKKGNGCKKVNRIVSSWSFYRLQQFINYKAKLNDIPVNLVSPNYTSQLCSYCFIIGKRKKKEFECNSRQCKKRKMNADINAAFCVGKRYLGKL